MARVVVIFAILSLITGAMIWLARHPSTHSDVVATIPVPSPEQPTSATAATPPTSTAAPSASTEATTATSDTPPPAEAAASASVPPLPTSGPEADVLHQSTTTSTPEAKTGLVVEDAQAGGDGSLSLKGRADPGATVRVNVDGKPAGEVVAGRGGSWSISVDKGKDVSEPKIVLELVGADGKVIDKTNFVFKSPGALPVSPQDHSIVTAQSSVQSKPEATAKPARHHRQRGSLRVRRGESLWMIAQRQLGDGTKWRKLYEANKDRIGEDPDYLKPGTRLVLPS